MTCDFAISYSEVQERSPRSCAPTVLDSDSDVGDMLVLGDNDEGDVAWEENDTLLAMWHRPADPSWPPWFGYGSSGDSQEAQETPRLSEHEPPAKKPRDDDDDEITETCLTDVKHFLVHRAKQEVLRYRERMLWWTFRVHDLCSLVDEVSWVDEVSDKYYLGATSGLARRWSELGHSDKRQTMYVLAFSTVEHIAWLERALIAQFRPNKKCTNQKPGGEGLGKKSEFVFLYVCSNPSCS